MIKQVKMRAMGIAHFIITLAVMYGVWFLCYVPEMETYAQRATFMSTCLVYLVFTAFLYSVYNTRKVGSYRVTEVAYSLTLADGLSIGVTWLVASIFNMEFLNPLPAVLVLALQTVVNIIWASLANKLYFHLHAPKRTLMIYRTEDDLEKLREIDRYGNRYDVQGRLCAPTDIHEIISQLEDYRAVFVSGIPATLRNGIAKACIDMNIECYFIPHTGDVIVSGAQHVQQFSIPIMRARRASLKPEYAFLKRALDVAVSLAGLIVLSPVMLIVALAIRMNDHGPVFYRQIRLTKDGKQFKILKFRSMRVDAEKDGVARLASDKDDRITPVGHFIRACRLDELPQLINILKGDMSLVGPRPERPEIAAAYEREMPAFSLRLQVKAGLTGTAQVYGRYNTQPKDKLKMDLLYINRMCMTEDLRLLFATARILFMRESTEGVAQGQTTASKSDVEKSA